MPPDVAVLTFGLRGEGSTQEAAIRALLATRDRIDAALAGAAQVTTGKLTVAAARDRACNAGDEDVEPRLSAGVCAIRGYVATLGVTARIAPLAGAGTLLGEVARLGATDPSIDRFQLLHPDAAQRDAVADAMRDARAQASAIAAASHVALGRLRRVEDQRATASSTVQDVIVTGSRRRLSGSPLPIALMPEPIETSATLVVEFEIGGS